MKISLNWLREYVDIKIPNDELVRLIGSRLVEVEEAIDETKKYDGIFVVKVLEAEKISDTHLTLCVIDDGGACQAKELKRREDGMVQVVCGAPNVRAGILAAWIAPGAVVPASFHDVEPFVIGMRKMMKQYDSYGMLASEKELDISESHDGIVELEPESAKPGESFAELFGLDDVILDIENKSLTHRPDCFGLIGFAREVAGILGQKFKTPEFMLSEDSIEGGELKPEIKIEGDVCDRYSVAIVDRAMNPERTKTYLDKRATLLARSGMKPISELVDATNYLMLLTGQPLHAFDYDEFVRVGGSDKAKVLVRTARKGEKLELLNDETIELTEDDIVITSNDVPVALAGAMGGKETEITENTKRVLLESATFNLYHLRKTQMAHGIFSEAITRFTKGQPAGQTLKVAREFIAEVTPHYAGYIAADLNKSKAVDDVKVTVEEINGLLGTSFSKDEIAKTLENVNFDVKTNGNTLVVAVPYWRTDIEIPEDVIEEVGRLNGYDNIAAVVPKHSTPTLWSIYSIKSELRDVLASFGANEVLTYSFVHSDLLEKANEEPKNSYKIINSISPELQYVRQSLVPSLLTKAWGNLKAGEDKFVLFEMNQIFRKSTGMANSPNTEEEKVPTTENRLAMVFADKKSDSSFYWAKKYLVSLAEYLGEEIEFRVFEAEKDQSNAFFEEKRSATVYATTKESGGMEIKLGCIGELKNSVIRNLKLPKGTAVLEIDFYELWALKDKKERDLDVSAYPKVSRDLTLSVKTDAVFGDYQEKIEKVLEQTGLSYRVMPTSIFIPEDEKSKNLSFHIELQSKTKTLTNAEVQDIMKELEAIK